MSAITIDKRLVGEDFMGFPFLDRFQLNFGRVLKRMSDEQFFEFCRNNPELRIEMTRRGEIIVMPPTFSETGGKNFSLLVKFGIWAEKDGNVLAYCRLFNKGIKYSEASIGRVLTTSTGRGKNIGKQLLKYAIDTIENRFLTSEIRISVTAWFPVTFEIVLHYFS